MREFNALAGYPVPKSPRVVSERAISNRITACYRGPAFFDGARADGYGGLADDGRWRQIARRMAEEYDLSARSPVLQINCEKGFLLGEFAQLGIPVIGTETSPYAIDHASVTVDFAPPTMLPYRDKLFGLVLAIGAVYTLTLAGAISCLREIERVKRHDGASFVTLGAWETDEDFKLLRAWSLLGETLLRKDEWLEVLDHAGYTGDYAFVTAQSLGLSWS